MWKAPFKQLCFSATCCHVCFPAFTGLFFNRIHMAMRLSLSMASLSMWSVETCWCTRTSTRSNTRINTRNNIRSSANKCKASMSEFSWQCVWLVNGIIINVECRNVQPLCGKETDSLEQLRTNRHDKFEFLSFTSFWKIQKPAETIGRLIGRSAEQLEEWFDDSTSDWTDDWKIRRIIGRVNRRLQKRLDKPGKPHLDSILFSSSTL